MPMKFLTNQKLSQKILTALSISTLLTALSITLFSYFTSRNALYEQTVRQLISVRDNKRDDIKDYLQLVEKLINNFAARRSVITALTELPLAFNHITDSISENVLGAARSSIGNYYQNEFLFRVDEKLTLRDNVDSYLPKLSNSIYLQYLYISSNPNPVGSKHLLDAADDGSSYSKWHKSFHSEFRLYLQQFGFYDIFLVDPLGNIVYTVFKETDYSTNLLNGPYSKTNIGRAFQKAQTLHKDSVIIVDFEEYIPSYGAPASFIAAPVYNGDQNLGVVIFQLPIDKINSILTNNDNWAEDGLGVSGETYIAGPDFKIRNNLRLLIEDKDNFLNTIKVNNQVSDRVTKRIDLLNTTILQLETDPLIVQEALRGESVLKEVTDYRSQVTFAAATGLRHSDLSWAIVAKVDKDEALAPAWYLRNAIILIVILVLIVVLIMGYYLAKNIARPLQGARVLLAELAEGKLPAVKRMEGKDETSQIYNAIKDVVDTQQQMVSFSQDIGKGNLDVSITPRSAHDVLGKSLLTMRDNLKRVTEEDSHRDWVTGGLAEFGQLLQSNHKLEDLSDKIIVELVRYVKANQGWLFLVEDEDNEADPYLKLAACYAWDKKKFVNTRIPKGHGLAGQCWIDGAPVYLTDIPKDYVKISSGLGMATPRCITIHPLKVNDVIYGILELASFEQLKAYHKKFLEKVCENIAAAIATVKINDRTRKLLEKAQLNTEQLKSQEEEIRQNMEELQSTQEEMRRRHELLERELEESRKEIQRLRAEGNGGK